MAYSKLYSSIVHSSLWTQPNHIRILFITLLAIADREGFVYGSKKGLLRLANVDPGDSDPFSVLTQPDKDSSDLLRNPENEGRRLEEVPGGFRILNFLYYRGLRNEDDRREQNRIAQIAYRKRHKQSKPDSAKLSQHKPISEAEAEAEEEKDKEKEENARKRAHYIPLPLSQKEVEDFSTSIGLTTSDGTAMWLRWQSQGFGKTRDWKAKIRQWKIQGFHPSQKQSQPIPKPKESAPLYDKLPPTREPTDEEFATAQRIAREEIHKLRLKLRSA